VTITMTLIDGSCDSFNLMTSQEYLLLGHNCSVSVTRDYSQVSSILAADFLFLLTSLILWCNSRCLFGFFLFFLMTSSQCAVM